jgi:CBS domain-containing protein
LSVHETDPEVVVKDIMSRPVITAGESDTVADAARLMAKHNVGCVLVSGKAGNTVGIITERDIVMRVAAKNTLPSDVKVSAIMSKPVVTIDSVAGVTEAAKLMNLRKIRRLAVMESGKLIGVLTMKDILEVTPALMDLMSERSRIGVERPRRGSANLAGYCDECETWSEPLIQKDGVFLCQDCAKDLGSPEEED